MPTRCFNSLIRTAFAVLALLGVGRPTLTAAQEHAAEPTTQALPPPPPDAPKAGTTVAGAGESVSSALTSPCDFPVIFFSPDSTGNGQGGSSVRAANDTNRRGDVFVRDLKTGLTTLVSVNRAGTDSGNCASLGGVLSANGRFVAFYSLASDLVATDPNRNGDVFVRDRKSEVTTLVSINRAGTSSGNGASYLSGLSANGRFVMFGSTASDLVTTDTNGTDDVFVRDRKTSLTTLVSGNDAGTDSGNSASYPDALSANDRFIAFNSEASDLVVPDTIGRGDVFVHDRKTGATTLVSINSAGTDSGNSASHLDALSANGRFVVFESFASDLVAPDTIGR